MAENNIKSCLVELNLPVFKRKKENSIPGIQDRMQ